MDSVRRLRCQRFNNDRQMGAGDLLIMFVIAKYSILIFNFDI